MALYFTASQLTAIADALGDTDAGLTTREIDYLIAECNFVDAVQVPNKRTRIFNVLAQDQNDRQDRAGVLAFIRKAMKPERHLKKPERYEVLRSLLNSALSFAAMTVDDSGELAKSSRASTIVDAKRRANELRADLVRRNVHDEVLKYCRDELLANNYFHAVLEAVKSVFGRIRALTGLASDGGSLIDSALGGEIPVIQINSLSSESERSEQKGFGNLLKGIFGMFRNTTAHEARIHWDMSKEDAEDLLSLVSLAHRRLDKAIIKTDNGDRT